MNRRARITEPPRASKVKLTDKLEGTIKIENGLQLRALHAALTRYVDAPRSSLDRDGLDLLREAEHYVDELDTLLAREPVQQRIDVCGDDEDCWESPARSDREDFHSDG